MPLAKNINMDTNIPVRFQPIANFDRRNTKLGSIKWTKSFVSGKKKLLRIRIYKIGFIGHLNMQTFHGLILATREKIVINKYGGDSRFWGNCYHTKEAAEKYG